MAVSCSSPLCAVLRIFVSDRCLNARLAALEHCSRSLRLSTPRILAQSCTVSCNADAGTDCALGEIFTLELPPGTLEVHLEVVAKHSLTGDEAIGTAKLSIDLIRNSDGEVLRVPVMSKKGSMHGELECTGSISDPGPSAPQVSSVTCMR